MGSQVKTISGQWQCVQSYEIQEVELDAGNGESQKRKLVKSVVFTAK